MDKIEGTQKWLSTNYKPHSDSWKIGDHTYGNPEILEHTMAKLVIGKYTSIAAGVTIALGNHRTDSVSTYPFAALRRYWPTVPEAAQDHSTRGGVTIGNDVWIGHDVFIGSGVTIGDGAVIGAKTVVTRSIPDYAVVVGTPARVAHYRFEADIIDCLLEIEWWNWPDERVASALPIMLMESPRAFIRAVQTGKC